MSFFKKLLGREPEEDGIQRDKDGQPVICDCPDGQEGPCDGKGWCRK